MSLLEFLDMRFLFGLFWRAAATFFMFAAARWLYHGYGIRNKVRVMKAQGAVSGS